VARQKHRPLFRRSPAHADRRQSTPGAWIDLGDLAASGAVVLWTVGDPHVLPNSYAAVARNATVQPPLTVPMRHGNGEVTVGWGIIPPGRASRFRSPDDLGDPAVDASSSQRQGTSRTLPVHSRLDRLLRQLLSDAVASDPAEDRSYLLGAS
jgi:hypothetical protein